MPKLNYTGFAHCQALLLASLLGPLLWHETAHAFVSTASKLHLSFSLSSTSPRQHHAPLQENLSQQDNKYYSSRLSAVAEGEEAGDADEPEPKAVSADLLSSQAPGFWTGPEESSASPLHDSVYTQVLTTVLPELGAQLRHEYDDHFADPRQPDAARFAWDPWFVSVGDTGTKLEGAGEIMEEGENGDTDEEELIRLPGEIEASKKQTQYSLKRIQTSQFFSEESYDLLVDELTALGRSVGLHAITPPWTSMYTDGDQQNWHTDAPHGPLAFVLSVCGGEGDFEGGETILLQPQILDFWKGFDSSKGLECASIVR